MKKITVLLLPLLLLASSVAFFCLWQGEKRENDASQEVASGFALTKVRLDHVERQPENQEAVLAYVDGIHATKKGVEVVVIFEGGLDESAVACLTQGLSRKMLNVTEGVDNTTSCYTHLSWKNKEAMYADLNVLKKLSHDALVRCVRMHPVSNDHPNGEQASLCCSLL